MNTNQRNHARTILNFLLKLAEAEAIRYEASRPLDDQTHVGIPDPVGALIADPRRSELSDVVAKAEHFLAAAARAAGEADAALTAALAQFHGDDAEAAQ